MCDKGKNDLWLHNYFIFTHIFQKLDLHKDIFHNYFHLKKSWACQSPHFMTPINKCNLKEVKLIIPLHIPPKRYQIWTLSGNTASIAEMQQVPNTTTFFHTGEAKHMSWITLYLFLTFLGYPRKIHSYTH